MIAPKEHGILFTGPMVRALLEGRKDVTRRTSDRWARVAPGDRLWVRETFATMNARTGEWLRPSAARALPITDGAVEVAYRADRMPEDYSCWEDHQRDQPPRWTPAIHMPRWASRLTLEVVSVTQEHGRGCTPAACGEGPRVRLPEVHLLRRCCLQGRPLPAVDDAEARREGVADRGAYRRLWESINGDDYPAHLWRLEFRVLP